MKNLLFTCLLFLSFSVCGQNKIVVNVNNFENNKGSCIVCLYNDAKAFAGKGSPVKCSTVSINNKTAQANFETVAEVAYAVSVIHDANNNKDLDKNKLGIPKEGFGFSNNVMGSMGPPTFERAQFDLASDQKDLDIDIKMKYM